MKKLYNWFACVGALKKWGFSTLKTIDGKAVTIEELRRHPPIANPTEPRFFPKRNGEIQTADGMIIVRKN